MMLYCICEEALGKLHVFNEKMNEKSTSLKERHTHTEIHTEKGEIEIVEM